MLNTLALEVCYALRALRRAPGFTAAVVATLALGIGANAALFGIVDRMLFRPPPRMIDPSSAHRVYAAWMVRGKERLGNVGAYARYVDLTTKTSSFSETAAFTENDVAVGDGEAAREMRIGMVSASFFHFFDARPPLGRYFTDTEDQPPQGAAVAVLSHAAWRLQYGERKDVVGSKVRIGPLLYTIIGVAPADFAGVWPSHPPAYFVPITTVGGSQAASMPFGSRWAKTYQWDWMDMLVRRKPGVTIEAANLDANHAMQESYAQLMIENSRAPAPTIAKPRVIVASVLTERGPTTSSFAKVFAWVAGVAFVVLLIACANVANLLLARAIRERRDLAVRLALGISRARLFLRLGIEMLALAVLGGAFAVFVGQLGNSFLRARFLPRAEHFSAFDDTRTIAFVAILVLGVALLTGLIPALDSRRISLVGDLRRSGGGGRSHRSALRSSLLAFQVALSVVLLVGAGLFVRSLSNVLSMSLGYDSDRVAMVELNMIAVNPRLDSARLVELRARLLARAQAIPGVENASLQITVPFWSSRSTSLYVEGIDSVNKLGRFDYNAVSPTYFATMGTRIVRGRALTNDDGATAQRVMVVSQSMARALWPQREPIGQCVRIGRDTMPCTQVVGVAEDIKATALSGDPGFLYYLPSGQFAPSPGGLFVRARGRATEIVETLRRELQHEMPAGAYVVASPFEDVIDRQTQSWNLGATMFLAFGLLALTVASIGLYGVVSYSVSQRAHELGVRSALGARGGDIVRLFVGDSLRIVCVGILAGGLFAVAAGKKMQPLLFEQSARDPLVFAVVIGTLVAVSLIASWIPARRGASVNPLTAIRAD